MAVESFTMHDDKVRELYIPCIVCHKTEIDGFNRQGLCRNCLGENNDIVANIAISIIPMQKLLLKQ